MSTMDRVDTANTTSSLAPAPYRTANTSWLPTLHQISEAVQLRMNPEVFFVPAPDAPVQPSLFELERERDSEEMPLADAEMANMEKDADSATLPAATDTSVAAMANKPAAQRVVTSVVTDQHPLAIGMRQGLLLVVLSALLAGLLPFIWNWYSAVQFDTVTPFVPLARFVENQSDVTIAADSGLTSGLTVLADTAATLVGLDPYWPVSLAAGFTAVGEWINWPLRWLSIWLVYGLGVFVICHLFGTTTTLQHFFAATGYAAVPLLLTGLYFVPVLGVVAVLAGIVWSVLVYVHGVRAVTGLDTFHAVLGVVAPAALMALLSFLAAVGLIAFVYALLL